MEVVVIDDRSSDGTGEVAAGALREAGFEGDGRVIRRDTGPDGKGGALAVIDGDPRADHVYLVLDADARVGREFVERACTAVARGSIAVTARRRMLRPVRGRVAHVFATIQDDEQAVDDVIQRGRRALGGAAEFRGNGMAVRGDVIVALGGWPADALCEDLDLSVRLFVMKGRGVDRPADLIVWEQPVTRIAALVAQRLRWAEGAVRRDLRLVWPAAVDRSITGAGRADVLAYAAQALVPWVAMGLALRLRGEGGGPALRQIVELAAGYLIASGTLAVHAVTIPATEARDRVAVAHRAARVGAVTLFGGIWLIVLPLAWLRVARRPGPPAFAKTVHMPTAAILPIEAITGDPIGGGPVADRVRRSRLGTDSVVSLAVRYVGLLAATGRLIRLRKTHLALGALRMAPPRLPDPATRTRARSIAHRFGRGALLPFQVGEDKFIHAPEGVDGMVVFGVAGRSAVVIGDPIGSDRDRWAALDTFLEACRLQNLVPAVYQSSGEARGPLAARGFRTIQIGREATIDLASFDLAGSRRANLRHTVTRARAGGVSVHVALDGLRAADRERLRKGLTSIDEAWRAQAGPEMGFTIGSFDPATLGSTSIAVAETADAEPIAFATFQPTGTDGGWVLDLMRRRSGGVPGAVEACLAETALAMRAAGSTTLSLGLVPLSGLTPDGATIEERLLARAARLARPFYDVSGLEFFKRKFDPTWEPMYVAIRSRRDLPGLVLALLRLHLGGLRHAGWTMVSSRLRVGPAPIPQIPEREPMENP